VQDGQTYWEAHPEDQQVLWEAARDAYAEWKMLEDDAFWAAVQGFTPTGRGGTGQL
jgi:hypothetical protein